MRCASALASYACARAVRASNLSLAPTRCARSAAAQARAALRRVEPRRPLLHAQVARRTSQWDSRLSRGQRSFRSREQQSWRLRAAANSHRTAPVKDLRALWEVRAKDQTEMAGAEGPQKAQGERDELRQVNREFGGDVASKSAAGRVSRKSRAAVPAGHSPYYT